MYFVQGAKIVSSAVNNLRNKRCTKVEKHCFKIYLLCIEYTISNQTSMNIPTLFAHEDGGVINKILIVCTSKIRQLVSKTRIKNLLLSYKVRSERNVNPLIIHLLLMHSAS